MCSISGGIISPKIGEHIRAHMAVEVVQAIWAGADRGRDSWGVALIHPEHGLHLHKQLGKPHWGGINDLLTYGATVILNNDRAEPTTEFVAEKRWEDVQPFKTGKWVIAHNGTIANDKELIKEHKLTTASAIDSAVIPELLDFFCGDDFDPEFVIKVIEQNLIGSYSLAIAHEDHPDKLLLMTNYKPLYIGYHRLHNYAVFSSFPEYIQDQSWLEATLKSPWNIQQVKPYSAVYISGDELGDLVFTSYDLKPDSTRRALVVCSGGLDSTVAATEMKRQGYDVTLVHFKYKCRAEEKEVEAIEQIARRLDCDFLFVDTDIFKEVIRGSRLTGTKDTVAVGEAGAEFAHEWVPARNLIMLSIATGIAEAQGFDTIVLGNNLEESGAYPDNEMEFIRKLNEVMPYATAANKHVTISMPVGNLMKHEIVKMGLEIGAPLDLTWSCYEGGDKHCGKCGPCFMRKTAFKINNVPEVIEYAE